MPTYKNTTDKDVTFQTGGLFKPGEAKTVADPINSPALELVDDEQATVHAELDHPQSVIGVEPPSNQEVTAAPPAPAVAPAPAPVQAPQPVAPAPAPAPAPEAPVVAPAPEQPNNITPQGA